MQQTQNDGRSSEETGQWQLRLRSTGILDIDFDREEEPITFGCEFLLSGTIRTGLATYRVETVHLELDDILSKLCEEGGFAELRELYGDRLRRV